MDLTGILYRIVVLGPFKFKVQTFKRSCRILINVLNNEKINGQLMANFETPSDEENVNNGHNNGFFPLPLSL